MTDTVTRERRSEIMSKIRSKDTKIELLLRRELWKHGLRYRKHYGEHSIDIAFPKRRLAVFIDGCFWHGCSEHFKLPQSNQDFWKEKINRNMARDRESTKMLESEGWCVLRFWEHELRDLDTVTEWIDASLLLD